MSRDVKFFEEIFHFSNPKEAISRERGSTGTQLCLGDAALGVQSDPIALGSAEHGEARLVKIVRPVESIGPESDVTDQEKRTKAAVQAQGSADSFGVDSDAAGSEPVDKGSVTHKLKYSPQGIVHESVKPQVTLLIMCATTLNQKTLLLLTPFNTVPQLIRILLSILSHVVIFLLLTKPCWPLLQKLWSLGATMK